MNEQFRESVSALMDGEASDMEVRRVLGHQDIDKVNALWERYHRQREVIDDDMPSFAGMDISGSVNAAIDKEAQYGPTWFSKLVQPAAGAAIAASVAIAVMVGVQGVNAPGDVAPVESLVSTNVSGRVYTGGGISALPASTKPVLASTKPARAQLSSYMPVALKSDNQFEEYVLRHAQKTSHNNAYGVMSYARTVPFDVEQQ